jgi:hypothetical protein
MHPKGHKNHNDIKHWIDLLPGLEGKNITYQGNIELLLHHEFDGTTITIKTNKRKRELSHKQLIEFLNDVELAENTNGSALALNDTHLGIELQPFKKLEEVLMANIEKVNADPKFIPQAQAVNEGVKQVIELQKTKLDFVKTMHQLKG